MLDIFRSSPGLSKLAAQVLEDSTPAVLAELYATEPPVHVILTEFWASAFATALLKLGPDHQLTNLFDFQMALAVGRLHRAVLPQERVLHHAMASVASVVQKLEIRGRCLVVEFPIGNSIPLWVLRYQLESHGVAFENIDAVLTRNEKQKAGTTRAQVIAQALRDAQVSADDVVVYVDEWVTGTNFAAKVLPDLLQAAAPARVLPVGLLAWNAKLNPNFSRHALRHDAACHSVDAVGESLRFEFPRNARHSTPDQPFFWSEADTLAGWRKVQLVGSHVRHLRTTLDVLVQDSTQFARALTLCAHEAMMAGLPEEALDELLRTTAEDAEFKLSAAAFREVLDRVEGLAFPDDGRVLELPDALESVSRALADEFPVGSRMASRLVFAHWLAFGRNAPGPKYNRRDSTAPVLIRLPRPHDSLCSRYMKLLLGL